MSKKNIKLGIILIVLVALAYLYQGPWQSLKDSWGKPKNFLSKVKFDEVNKIEIIKAGEIVTLEREDDRWKVSGTKDFYVDLSVSSTLKLSLADAIAGDFDLISTNKENKSDFLTDDSGIEVKLFQGDKEYNFVVGKMAPDYQRTYISQSNIDETYAVEANLFYAFNQDDWRSKVVFDSDKEKITKIRFQYPNREFTIEKKDNTWIGTIPYEFEVDQENVGKVLEVMSDLDATQIPEQTFDGTGLEKNLIIVQASGEGVDNTLMIGEANEEELFFAKKGDSDNIYLISKDKRDELDKNISDF